MKKKIAPRESLSADRSYYIRLSRKPVRVSRKKVRRMSAHERTILRQIM